MQSTNRRNVFLLAFVLAVVTLGFGLIIPIMPFYVEHMGAGGAELGLLVSSYAVMRLICGPLWGALSDRIGRKPVLMVGVLGYAITMIWFGLAGKLWELFVARILSGILSSATSPTTMAYISDSTSEDERGRGMGILGAAIGLGTVLGPGIGGIIAGDHPSSLQLALPFFAAGGLSLLALLLAWLVLPESLTREARQMAQTKPHLPAWGQLTSLATSALAPLLGMAFLMSFALTAFYGIFGLYALDKFNYSPQQVGIVITVVSLVSAVVQGGLTGPLTNRWGEARLIRGSLLGSAVGFILILLAGSFVQVILATAFFSLAAALLSPAVSSLTSKRTDLPQGMTMGISNAFISLGRIAGPLWAGFAFDINLAYPYLGSAIVMVVGFFAALVWVRPADLPDPSQPEGNHSGS